ncbi:chromatin target of PRMT1b [Myxocyprinus asiaticus]|uniref:chromatin target of PRMT1b n=1 Tax=Myxocyprinus asiaticus TaxID=70543 RepID=UPI002222D847|nr:chromatin target of PRMT1b [Myxocyprinus asiaticus]
MWTLDVKMNPSLDQPKKFILDSTSTVSLHDRFTSLLKHQQESLMDITASVNQHTAASLENQRLALEMANRPSVLAALHNTSKINNSLCKMNVKARLGQPMGRGGMMGLRGQMRGGGSARRGLIKGIYSRRGISSLQGAVSTLGVQRGWGQHQRGGYMHCAGSMGIRGRRAIRKTGMHSPLVCTGNSHVTSVSGTYTGCNWTKSNSQPVPSREQLDKQLDEYMSMTKSHLDAELDAYMAQVDLEDIV